MKIVATIEARMSSSRLPGKVLLPALGRPMLWHLVQRLRAVPSINEIVVAATVHPSDDAIEKFCREEGVPFFRGSEDDVMGRVIGAAESVSGDIIVEITGDCPILDPDLAEQTIRMFLRNGSQYAANSFISSYPDGMDIQVFPLEVLKRSYSMTEDPLDREHVSRHIVQNPGLFRHLYVVAPPSLSWPGLGLTLDEPADYELIKRIIEHFGEASPLFGCGEVIELLKSRPDWLQINSTVERRDARPV